MWHTESDSARQASEEKHFSRGCQFISNWTWSKDLDSSSVATAANTGPVFDPYNLRNNRGLSDLSVPAIFNNTFVYQEPSMRNLGRVGSFVLGGWEVAGIWVMSSGLPFSIMGGSGNNNSASNIGGDRANIIPGAPLDEHQGSLNQWLNR